MQSSSIKMWSPICKGKNATPLLNFLNGGLRTLRLFTTQWRPTLTFARYPWIIVVHHNGLTVENNVLTSTQHRLATNFVLTCCLNVLGLVERFPNSKATNSSAQLWLLSKSVCQFFWLELWQLLAAPPLPLWAVSCPELQFLFGVFSSEQVLKHIWFIFTIVR